MKKKLISLLTVLSVTIMFLGTPINITAAAEGGCDGTHSDMSAWIHDDYLPTSGNYYLDKDVNLSSCSYTGSLTLCLNGHTITAVNGNQIFSISGSLTLCDCSSGKTGKLSGGDSVSTSGGAVDVTRGTFTMNGGTISGNTAGTGGGVFVQSGASFIMNGGTISNNTTKSNGGGVYSSGIFTMNGGTISDNTTNSNAGGGVFVASSGTFIMNGGMISSNTAAIRGGGVYVNGGTFTMNGGIISGNTTAEKGGGVCINGTFEINGKVNISGNTKTDGSDNNVYLFTGKKISIGNDFNTSSTIGVNTEAELANCKNYADVTGAATSDISDSFKADIDGQNIVYNGGKVQLTKAHDYSTAWTMDDTNHWHKCNNCDAVNDEAQHTGGTATCTVKAICEICGNEYGEYDSDNHNFVNGVCECGETDPNYVPPHEHNFVNGVCECGETDPNYVPPHEHNFVNGVCECGETDPNYVPPHEHNFVNGVCECGETDPNYVPPHEHTFVNGVCECGETDPNYVPPHEHNFVNGVCECGETDPNYVPPHEHNFVNGMCECGETDPNYVPPHNHTFVDGVCECGETDPNYVPPHEHNFVNGVCECGETDPNYVPPHEHNFVNGVCECGETDPNYVPPHEHNFVNGVCECGETDPTYNQSGSVTEDVQDDAGTNASLDNSTLNNALDPDDLAMIEEGHDFKIVLKVTDIRDSVSSEDKAAASSVLKSGEEIGVYVDLSLFKIMDGTEKFSIHDTNGRQIEITLTIPDSIYAGNRTYSIIRVHDGVPQNLGGAYNKATRRLTFSTDRFSTYAIAFTASSVNIDPPTIPTNTTNPTTPTTPSKPSGSSTPSRPSSPSSPSTPSTPSAPAVTPTVTEAAAREEEIIYGDEPYMEDVSSGAGIFETDDNSHTPLGMIVIIIAVLGVSSIIIMKRFAKNKR